MSELTKIQKNGENLIIVLSKEIAEKLDLEEGTELELEHFICSGNPGIRIKKAF